MDTATVTAAGPALSAIPWLFIVAGRFSRRVTACCSRRRATRLCRRWESSDRLAICRTSDRRQYETSAAVWPSSAPASTRPSRAALIQQDSSNLPASRAVMALRVKPLRVAASQ
jgi:hypothetical protein